ncbi:tail fiber protein [Chromobacterium aquaticum]|uniref:Tail fiber protein n=1 Tax=Chromobacterium aquaticum TaxID=467180 RepID=A0ABV8ZT46_9NEIS|nr:LamG-like jellyroll fold domain-containing protein [Chromobacterium aquaticum]MCD5360703.1 tail fiber protein [Chromobacterium aquaticum]
MQEALKPINTPDTLFHDGNPTTGELGTIVSADWLNKLQQATRSTQEELIALIKDSGQALDANRKDQLLQAVKKMAWGGDSKPTTLAGYGITDGATTGQLRAAAPAGEVAYFAMPVAPEGWLRANGTQVLQSTYPGLFSAIGHRFAPIKSDVQAMLRLDELEKLADCAWGSAVSTFGGAGMSTEQAKFGTQSLKTLENGGYASMPLAEAFNPNEFTIEGWHFPNFTGTGNSNGYQAAWIISMNQSKTWGEITISCDKASKAPVIWLAGAEPGFIVEASAGTPGIFSTSRWYHIAFCYDGQSYRLYVDGVLTWSLSSTRRVFIADSTLLFGVDGCAPGLSGSSSGYYQDWKVSKKNLYAQPFSPPTALAAYRAEANPGKFYLPNLNGQFLRGWGDERGVDGGRSFGGAQLGSVEAHRHPSLEWSGMSFLVNDIGQGDLIQGTHFTGYSPTKYAGRVNVTGVTGGSETRPRNIALLACIKY